MGRQLRLVPLLLLFLGLFQVALTSTPKSLDDEISINDLQSIDILSTEDHVPSGGIKLSTPKVKEIPIGSTIATIKKALPTSTTQKPISNESLNDLIEASKHNVALANDPRFNKMLPDQLKTETNSSANKSEIVPTANKNDDNNYEDYEEEDDTYDYDDDYNYDENVSTEPPTKKSKTLDNKTKKIEMKPIKEEKKVSTKPNETNKQSNELPAVTKEVKKTSEKSNSPDDETHDDYSDELDDDDDDEDDNDDEITDEEEIVFNENVPCPRYCVCERNLNSYLVATCSRFDPGTQKFGSDITDLIVSDVGPKYPILLGPEFFLQMGLKRVSSIKIFNCTIEHLHPKAFHGLDELYSVNLTKVGLSFIDPNTFSKNKKLRMLTVTGNDLSAMSNLHYLLNSSSIEELDLSRNKLLELHPKAFSKLPNIVYINLSQNNLQRLPPHIFDTAQTIEELDLSYNSLQTLPPAIFNRTTLAILHLKYNSITGDLRFGNSDLQQLDLSFNSINHVHHGMFDKMSGLTNLNLKANGITTIQPDSFLALKNLRHIDLSINELDQVSSMLFYKNSELDVIRLNDNPRLSQLPTDGFRSVNGYFVVYYLDISNCAIGAIGHNTFSTMPHLARLKLAWNNINNLERDTFSALTKLTDLDLSNNLIARLDELTFMNNNDLTKLNLAGNPINKLSVRLFLPLNKLRELDVSDCDLKSLLSGNEYGVGRKYKFYNSLRVFNASSNLIKNISANDVKKFKNLRTLDVTKNPLSCNEGFQDFITYVSLKSNLVPKKVPTLENLESDATYIEDFKPQEAWTKLAHEVCLHHESEEHKANGNSYEEADKNLYMDAKHLLDIIEKSKMNKLQKILQASRKKEVVISQNIDDNLYDDDNSEDELNNASEAIDDNDVSNTDDAEENASDYDEDDQDDDDENEDDYNDNNSNNDNKKNKSPTNDDNDDKFAILERFNKKHNNKLDAAKPQESEVTIENVELHKEVKDKFLLNKFLLDGDEMPNNNEEEIIIEHGRIYSSGYRFILPGIVLFTCIIILLLILVKCVTVLYHKKGERYRMALRNGAQNNMVYQKLSEDIYKPEKQPKQPSVHRYAPVNQV